MHIAHQIGMLNGERRVPRVARFARMGAGGLILITLASSTAAQDQNASQAHVRGIDGMRQFVEDAAHRSPAIREWIDRLLELDVTVYVRARHFARLDLDGRVAPLSKAGSHRYLVIELACGRSELTQMTTLGHELFHAIEIAEEPSVVNAETLAAFYTRIGVRTGGSAGGGPRTFETEAAAAAGLRARRQLLTSTRHTDGT